LLFAPPGSTSLLSGRLFYIQAEPPGEKSSLKQCPKKPTTIAAWGQEGAEKAFILVSA